MVVFLVSLVNAAVAVPEDASVSPDAMTFEIGGVLERSDRLIRISGKRSSELHARFSVNDGETWHAATVFVGTTIDEWRPCDAEQWNAATIEGRLPAGEQACLWNYFFDLQMPAEHAVFRLQEADGGQVVLEKRIDFRDSAPGFVIDQRNVAVLAGGRLSEPWRLQDDALKGGAQSFGVTLTKRAVKTGRYPIYQIDEAAARALVLKPSLKGWHRIYLGMGPHGSVRLSLSGEGIDYPIPEYHNGPTVSNPRLMQEFYVKSADLTDQNIHLKCGGARYWRDASVRYIRFAPMATEEVKHFKQVREFARTSGRPFAGYVEQCTPCNYEPASMTLLAHTRNEMRLNKVRGCTDVYVHVIRVGSKAWYHSDVVERHLPTDSLGPHGPAAKWTAWMEQDDPMAVSIAEARDAGLKVFADMGMNVSYESDLRERTITEHPEFLCDGKGIFLDYRKPPVRDYAVSIAEELLTKYDVDGIHLDFARFAANRAFDEESLVDVVGRIHQLRQDVQKQRQRRIVIAARIPSYRYHEKNAPDYQGDYSEFLAALRRWARAGQIDRVMTCSMGHVGHVAGLSLDRYKAAIKDTNVELWGDLYGGGAFQGTPRSAWLNVARKWVSEGLEDGFFFYAMDRPTEFEQINWQLRLIDSPDMRVEPGRR